jgi:hypothetical protein
MTRPLNYLLTAPPLRDFPPSTRAEIEAHRRQEQVCENLSGFYVPRALLEADNRSTSGEPAEGQPA